jgi:hypothetical protein
VFVLCSAFEARDPKSASARVSGFLACGPQAAPPRCSSLPLGLRGRSRSDGARDYGAEGATLSGSVVFQLPGQVCGKPGLNDGAGLCLCCCHAQAPSFSEFVLQPCRGFAIRVSLGAFDETGFTKSYPRERSDLFASPPCFLSPKRQRFHGRGSRLGSSPRSTSSNGCITTSASTQPSMRRTPSRRLETGTTAGPPRPWRDSRPMY